jgi:hypothetical protein
LVNQNPEIVRTTKPAKTTKHLTQSIYSKKHGMGDSMRGSNTKLLQSRMLNQSRAGLSPSRPASSKALTSSKNESKLVSACNTTKDFSQFLKDTDDKSSQLVEVNKTYKTFLASDPADRLRPKKQQQQGSPGKSGGGGGQDAKAEGKLVFEEYTKSKAREYRPEMVYDNKSQAFNHMFSHVNAKEQRQKTVGNFMVTLQKEMEERKVKERREELKHKINQKVPPKVRLEDYLTDKVI